MQSRRGLVGLQRFPDPPRPLPRPCDHGVNLGEHSRCQRRAAEKAVDADGAAEQEFKGVTHQNVIVPVNWSDEPP